MEFEKSMSSVQAFVSGAAESMDQLNSKAIELGGSTAFTGAQVADAMVELGKAGLSAKEVLNSIGGVLSLATAGSLGIAEAAGVAGSALKQFGLDASQTTFVADALAKAASSGNTTLGILGNQLTFASQAAQRAGMDFEETIAFISFLSDGIGAEKAGRGAASIFSAMSAPTDAARKAMKELGVSFTTASGQFKALPNVVNEFNSALVALNPEEKSRLLGAIFNEQAIRGFEFALKRGGDSIDSAFQKVKQNSGFADEVANVLLDNTSGAFTKIGNSFSAVATNLWQAFGPPAKGILEGWAIIFNSTIVPASAMLGTMFDGLADGSAWRRFKEHATSALESVGESVVKTFTGIEKRQNRLLLAFEEFEHITEPINGAGTPPKTEKSFKELATSVFGADTFGAAEAAAENVRAMEKEAAQRDLLSSGFQDFMNEPLVSGLSMMSDSLPRSADALMELDEKANANENAGSSNPLNVALKGSREAFDVINKAIKGTKDAHQKTIAKESEKQTKLLQKTVDLIDGIPDAMSQPEVFSFA